MKKTLLFAVNSKQKRFFSKIARHLSDRTALCYSKRIVFPSLRALPMLAKADLSAPIRLKTDDFVAKRGYPALRPLVRLWATLLAYYNFMRYSGVIDGRYRNIMLWNGTLFRQAIACEAARLQGIGCIYVETGLLPGRITVDPKGVNFYNSVPRERAFYENYHNARPLPRTLIPRNPKNAAKFASERKVTLPRRYIFIPFQVDYDTQILVHSPWIRDMEMLFGIIERISQKIENLSFVFKEHPSSIKNYPQLHARAEGNARILFANGHTTQRLIEGSEGVITVNSTVGIESLLFGKRVIVLGNAFYEIEGITKSARSTEALQSILAQRDRWQPDRRLIENFLKYLYYDYQIEGTFEEENPAQIARIAELLDSGNQ